MIVVVPARTLVGWRVTPSRRVLYNHCYMYIYIYMYAILAPTTLTTPHENGSS